MLRKMSLILVCSALLVPMLVLAQSQESVGITTVLHPGDHGNDVSLLQAVLAADPSVYPEGIVSGYFGPLTEAAVSRFQAKHNLEQVGQVGPKTRMLINQLFFAVSSTPQGQSPQTLELPSPSAENTATSTVLGSTTSYSPLTPPLPQNFPSTSTLYKFLGGTTTQPYSTGGAVPTEWQLPVPQGGNLCLPPGIGKVDVPGWAEVPTCANLPASVLKTFATSTNNAVIQ